MLNFNVRFIRYVVATSFTSIMLLNHRVLATETKASSEKPAEKQILIRAELISVPTGLVGTSIKDLRNKLTMPNAKVLAAPTLRALNGKEVTWTTGSESDSITKLKLKPTINRDSTITVELRPQIRVSQASDQMSDPNITAIYKTKYMDHLVAKAGDGETIVVRGLENSGDYHSKASDSEPLIFLTLKVLNKDTVPFF